MTTLLLGEGGSLPLSGVPNPPPPNAGAPVELERVFWDYKLQNGLNWPHRIKETGDESFEEIRLGKYKINPTIDARKFDPSRYN